jgi:hypothetical protein
MISLSLRCRLTAENGGVQINGQVNVCPAIGSVEVMPAEAFVGRTMALRGPATDVDGKPQIRRRRPDYRRLAQFSNPAPAAIAQSRLS